MELNTDNLYVRRLKVVLLISSVVSLVLLLLSAFEENLTGAWRDYQKQYREVLVARADTDSQREAARAMGIGFQQAYLPDLERVDRCVTCHAGIEDPGQQDAAQPLASHPPIDTSGVSVFAHHPVERFGCTICHAGQGRAVEEEAAHGHGEHWPEPMLAGEAVYTSCGRCHYENDLYGAEADLYAAGAGAERSRAALDRSELGFSVPGVTSASERAIGRGKQLVLDSGCLGCHRYRGRGGTLGPEITYVGDKTKHDFDFANVEGPHTVEQWLFEHFKRPGEVVPGTLMPELGLSDEDARDLAQYMLSLRRKDVPAAYTPAPPRRSGEPVEGKTMFGMFCSSCHGEHGQGSMVLDPELMMLADAPEDLMTPSISNPDTLAVASDEYFRRIIASGRRDTNMLSWAAESGGLTTGEIERLVEHIRDWEPVGADPARISSERGVARYGESLYGSRCAPCHGRNGRGGIGVALNVPTFLVAASDEFLARSIIEGRRNTAMPAWKQLSEQEVCDLVAFMRTWQPSPAAQQDVLAGVAERRASGAGHRIGEALYRGKCSSCHGLHGDGGIGPSLSSDEFLAVVDDAYLSDSIRLGRPGTAMPAWAHLTADDVAELVWYMRTWNDDNHIRLDDYLARGDRDRGQLLFGAVCSSCHGSAAQGATGPQLNNPQFLASASDAVLRHWVTYGRAGTEMRAFGKGEHGVAELTTAQVEDIVTYLRGLETERPVTTSRPGLGIVPLGQEVYVSACAPCHGMKGEGATGSALSNREFLQAASDGYLQATIVLGRDGTPMRAMGEGAGGNVELSSEDVNNVVAYIRSWEHEPPHAEGVIPHRFVFGADLVEGEELYVGHCSGCHGVTGKGAWAPELNNLDFLQAATDGFLQATVARGRSNTPMRAFGIGTGGVAELSSDQINNIVAYIRMWEMEAFDGG
ncbi:MAG: hypothetical protein D8M59_01870 [Planctomycetes bacterium]|nr:hypothetical protein [Planctomycetota bacterium]NOG54533.1 c-type cytochrome [Planctomycetota bacterium]